MKIVHRVTINADAEVVKTLSDLGVIIGKGLSTFVVDEANPHWPQIERIISYYHPVDIVSTKFTSSELVDAHSLQIKSTWHWGYPQPEHDYLNKTYDLSDYCTQCGIGAKQNASFRLLGEPAWGDRSIVQINWVFDEFFVRRDAWEDVLLPLGIQSRPVVDHHSGAVLSSVVQCDVETISENTLDLRDHPFRHCPKCERRKYLPYTRGCFPKFVSGAQEKPVVKSKEFFGDGAKAFRAVLILGNVYASMTNAQLRGCSFTPVCE